MGENEFVVCEDILQDQALLILTLVKHMPSVSRFRDRLTIPLWPGTQLHNRPDQFGELLLIHDKTLTQE
jgi:hypothetical protein